MTLNTRQDDQDVVVDFPSLRNLLSRMWKGLATLGIIGLLVGVGASFLVAKRYTATITMIPQVPAQKAGLLGRLASLTDIGADLGTNNEALFGQILDSDRILDRALARRWPTPAQVDGVSLYEVLGIETVPDAASSSQSAIAKRKLRNRVVSYNRDPVNGFMKVRVTLPESPGLAADLANFLVDELDRYNREILTRNARETREFIETTLANVEGDLIDAENAMTNFAIGNEMYESSPRLHQKYQELEREVQAQRSMWIELRTQLESAKVDEHKDLSTVHVLDRAMPPTRKSYPGRALFGLLGFATGLILFIAWRLVSGRKDLAQRHE